MADGPAEGSLNKISTGEHFENRHWKQQQKKKLFTEQKNKAVLGPNYTTPNFFFFYICHGAKHNL